MQSIESYDESADATPEQEQQYEDDPDFESDGADAGTAVAVDEKLLLEATVPAAFITKHTGTRAAGNGAGTRPHVANWHHL